MQYKAGDLVDRQAEGESITNIYTHMRLTLLKTEGKKTYTYIHYIYIYEEYPQSIQHTKIQTHQLGPSPGVLWERERFSILALRKGKTIEGEEHPNPHQSQGSAASKTPPLESNSPVSILLLRPLPSYSVTS